MVATEVPLERVREQGPFQSVWDQVCSLTVMEKEGALPDLGRLAPEPSLPGDGVRQPEGRAPVGQSQAQEGILEK